MTGMPWVWSEVNIAAWRSTVNKLAQKSQIAGMNCLCQRLPGWPTLRSTVDELAMWC